MKIAKFSDSKEEDDFYEGESILEIFWMSGIVEINKEQSLFEVVDGCDQVFRAFLTKEQMIQLGNEIIDLADKK